MGLGDSLDSTRGAVAAIYLGRETLAIPAGEWVEVLLLGPGQSNSHGCGLAIDPSNLNLDLGPQTDFPA